MNKHVAMELGDCKIQDFCADCGQLLYKNHASQIWAHAPYTGLGKLIMPDHPPARLTACGDGESKRVVYDATISAC